MFIKSVPSVLMSGYIAGLSQDTKNPITEHDAARLKIRTTPGEKWIALNKYKTLRNRVTQQIRLLVKQANDKKIDEANNESEYWKIVNDITNPRTETIW